MTRRARIAAEDYDRAIASSSIKAGSLIGGDFVVERPLASGGMGTVFIAQQRSTGRRCAVKVMHGPLAEDAKLRERFLLEAQVPAQIPSPHIVGLLGSGVDPQGGEPWLAMELLEGLDLRDHVVGRGALALDEVRGFLAQLGEGLGLAHRSRIVHRDLKPRNVFVTATPSGPLLKVLDFGIAKVVSDATRHSTAALGSPAWMAPEQTEEGGDICPGTDVWALGLLTFFMLTGKPYWRAAASGGGAHKVLRELLFEPLVPGSARAAQLAGARPFPAELDPWLARCLDRQPRARFVDAAEAVAAFEATLRGDVSATAPHAIAAARPSAGPSKALLFGGLAAVAIVFGGILGGLVVSAQRQSEESVAPPAGTDFDVRLSPDDSRRCREELSLAKEEVLLGHTDGAIELAEACLERMKKAGLSNKQTSPLATRAILLVDEAAAVACEKVMLTEHPPSTYKAAYAPYWTCHGLQGRLEERWPIAYWSPGLPQCRMVLRQRPHIEYAKLGLAWHRLGVMSQGAKRGMNQLGKSAVEMWAFAHDQYGGLNLTGPCPSEYTRMESVVEEILAERPRWRVAD